MFPKYFGPRYFAPRYFPPPGTPATPAPASGVRLDERGEYVFGNVTERGERVIGSLTATGRFVFPVSAPIIVPQPPIIGGGGGWGTTRSKRPRTRPRPRVVTPRHLRDTGLVELRLSMSAHDRTIAREWAAGALRLHASGTAILRVQDGDWIEMYLLGLLTIDDLIALDAPAHVIEAALLLG